MVVFGMIFEIKYSDLGGRIGKLRTPRGIVETPAFIPVVHPIKQSIPPDFLKELGFDVVITNAYIAFKQYGNMAIERGIHEIIGFDGTVMTDSGGYQVLEYGSIRMDPSTMAIFQIMIKSDICIPLDKPTGYGLDYDTASLYVDETIGNVNETLQVVRDKSEFLAHNPIWVGPVQGAEHLNLVHKSAKIFDNMNFEMLALGSPVQVMESYEFGILAKMIATLKNTIPTKPVHLFGAGHPLTIPLAVALGCDTFDSASYILYARDNRYMHTNGTSRLEDISYFSCQCPICLGYRPKELLTLDYLPRVNTLAKHNLFILRAEVLAVKQAIKDGRLWEYVMQKAHAHPKLMEATRLLVNFDFIDAGTPLFKRKAIFFNDPFDQYRPEAKRYRKIVSKFHSQKLNKLIVFPEGKISPFYTTKAFTILSQKYLDFLICTYNPFLGIIPAEISDIFPASHNLGVRTLANKVLEFPTFVEAFKNFLDSNKFEEIIIVANEFMIGVIELMNIGNAYPETRIKILDYGPNSINNITL
jgi:7-cyano-7-deazaguanine tRNA-ribosyltransferase